ncbi:valacyclovir hydrolase isoform X2 [Stomoxys calcitrans]|uniref:valacyclovir hydrolase isoform X2 n=1 Tax=Stomoxys calcitrans TaxID=35570 RepID=UPI0027E27296|nr:valacyclovir hydrolase isoform X2 [Stomoxys calcitrans]
MQQSYYSKTTSILNILKATRVTSRRSHMERKVKVNNLDVNIVECGAGPKSVLLMPGVMGSIWTDFAPQIKQLPGLLPNHTIIACDPPGCGKSMPLDRKWTINAVQEDGQFAMDLMLTLERPKFSILGWSAGGNAAIVAASRYQNNIEKLVIWGTGAYVTPEEVKLFEGMRDVGKWPVPMREPMETVYGAERFHRMWNGFIDAVQLLYSERNGDMCKSEVDMVKAPTFILHGKKDFMKDPVHVPYLREHIKNTRYHEFPEGKHNIHLRYPDEFNRLVADFLLDQSEKS